MSTSLCGKEAGVTVAESGALAAAEVMGGLSWGLDWQKEGYISLAVQRRDSCQ